MTVAVSTPYTSANASTSFGRSSPTNADVAYLTSTGFGYYDDRYALVEDPSFGTAEIVDESPFTVRYTRRRRRALVGRHPGRRGRPAAGLGGQLGIAQHPRLRRRRLRRCGDRAVHRRLPRRRRVLRRHDRQRPRAGDGDPAHRRGPVARGRLRRRTSRAGGSRSRPASPRTWSPSGPSTSTTARGAMRDRRPTPSAWMPRWPRRRRWSPRSSAATPTQLAELSRFWNTAYNLTETPDDPALLALVGPVHGDRDRRQRVGDPHARTPSTRRPRAELRDHRAARLARPARDRRPARDGTRSTSRRRSRPRTSSRPSSASTTSP